MTHVFEIFFWFGIAWLAYVYVGYPAILWLIRLSRPVHTKDASNGYLPRVSVLISARNEQKDIGWKIAETLAWDYPAAQLEVLVASDASRDATDEILAKVRDPRFRFLRLDERRGKNEALNRLNDLAHGELLFFTDANSHIEPQSLRKMVRHFADPRVGCVTGIERTLLENDESAIATGSRASLGYEAFVNTLESRLGSVLVADGSIFCVRRRLFHTLQEDLANDFELPAQIANDGSAILFDPELVSLEKSTSSPSEEFNRKCRICGQGILGFWRLRRCFHGLRAWQLMSRKFLRWFGLIPLALIFASNLRLLSHTFYASIFVLQILFYTLAGAGWLSARHGRSNKALTFPFFFVLVNVAAFVGITQAVLGRRFGVWESASDSRGSRSTNPISKDNRLTVESVLPAPSATASREWRAGKQT